MKIGRIFLLWMCAATAGNAWAGGGPSRGVHYQTVSPYWLMQDSRFWKSDAMTLDVASNVVAESIPVPSGTPLPWEQLMGIHAKSRGETPSNGEYVVTLRFPDRILTTDDLPRPKAADLVCGAAYLAGWEPERVQQTTIPGTPPPANPMVVPIALSPEPIPRHHRHRGNGVKISTNGPSTLVLQPIDPPPEDPLP